MRIIKRNFSNLNRTILILGRAGENNATKLELDVSKELREYPDATFELVLNMPVSQEPYPVIIDVSGGILSYSFSGSDLSKDGNGQIEALVYSNGDIIKTATANAKIFPSIISNSYPGPLQKVIDDLQQQIEESEIKVVSELPETAENNTFVYLQNTGFYVRKNNEWVQITSDACVSITPETFEKLNSIETGAEVNVIDAITLNGEPITVTNKTAAISAVVDNNYVHTDNNFTNADKSKLAAADVKYSVQHYADLSSLPQTAGTRATVQSDGNQLAFGTFDLQINDDLAAPAVFPIPNMSNIGGIYDYPSGGSGRSVTVGFTVDATDGTPLILVYVTVNGVTYLGISRDATIGNTALTKGWYNVADSTPAEKPTLDDFKIVRFSLGGTTYTSGDTLPTDRIKLLSRFINISQNDMRGAGDYVYNGSAWEYVPKEDELLYFFGELLPNKKYFCDIGSDMSLTLPTASAIDTSRDNSILLYLECSADIDLSLPSDTRLYGGTIPDTTTGQHELTFVYNPNAGVWTVGCLTAEEAS